MRVSELAAEEDTLADREQRCYSKRARREDLLVEDRVSNEVAVTGAHGGRD